MNPSSHKQKTDIVVIPGRATYDIENLVLDYNGTIARDGILFPKIIEILNKLAESFTIYILTADTYGRCAQQCEDIKATVHILTELDHTREKAAFVTRLSPDKTVAVGNGANDAQMLKKAAIGIAVLGDEGVAVEAMNSADILAKDIYQALELLEKPTRMIATLRR